ncbi:MAG TPA: ATPase, T2SS/T4P/T4SS family [Tepidisphaeraceae bacterium]|jgi:type II secretory ATPase GspE/PulE/Tfp pilus assembly ATPase PilB-like protein
MDQPHLDIQTPEGHRQQALGRAPVTIGRHVGNLIILPDTMASRYHAVVEKVGGEFQLRDLGSRNGTLLNGRPVQSAILSPGDVIRIGECEMTFMLPGLEVLLPASAHEAPGDRRYEEAETLTEADIVEEFHSRDYSLDDDAPVPVVQDQPREDVEKVLERLSASLPSAAVPEEGIALLNARGKIIHEAGPARKGGKRDPVDVFRLLLSICSRTRATDIHLEPKEDHFQLRLRIDGSMTTIAEMAPEMGTRFAALVKVLCEMDLGQRNVMQEGHFAAKLPTHRVDYRVSFAPSVYGQKLVIRILDTANAPLKIEDLQMPQWMKDDLQTVLQQEAGMVLVAGPTGSGKTTSLYALVRSSDIKRRNMVTIEDPVEVQIPGVTQIQVDEGAGNSFSNLLRSVLRQDPDTILVGEIRDSETARIAMQASITGHMVFSTIHTKDTVGTIFRLLDLGVEPYLIAQGLHRVLAQRLARQLCRFCKVQQRPTPEQLIKMGGAARSLTRIFVPRGCPRCLGTGFFGRRAFFELLATTDELRDLIGQGPTQAQVQQALGGAGFTTLLQSGYHLVAEGVVAFDEIDRALGKEPRPGA